MISVFGGTGFVLGEFCNEFGDFVYVQRREDYTPKYPVILYGISTVHNYNVFTNPHLDIDTNLTVLINVLENARNTFGNKFIFNFISSWFVYGAVPCPAKEDFPCNPKGFYSITKRTAEQLLVSYCETFGIKYRILRLANVLGIGDLKISRQKNAVQYMVSEVAKGHDINYLYEEDCSRDFIDVRDCAKAINLIISEGEENGIYNVGNGRPESVNHTVLMAKEISGSGSNITLVGVPEFHKTVQAGDMWLDTTKLKNLGYVREYEHLETIQWLTDYYSNER